MIPSTIRTLPVVVAVALVLAVLATGVGAAEAAAQTSDEVQDEAEEQAEGQIEEQQDDESDEDRRVARRVDDRIVVESWSYDPDAEQFEVVLRNDGDRPVSVTLSERMHEDTETISIRTPRVLPTGTTTVEVDAATDDDGVAGVAVSTSQSIQQGRAEPIVYTGESSEWFNGPATWGLVFLAVVAAGYGTFWGTKRYLEKQEREQNERRIEVVR